ncbi:MAG: acetyl-CoA synthetase [Candidatus Micrarchaeota archaeon]|nr:acetyl-CoA synthetase [Candidatus Micrarchaeota archaeon]
MRKLSEEKARILAKKWGIRTASEHLARTKEAALDFAKKSGYPVVVKIASSDIIHKTDCGCVITNIGDAEELERAFDTVISNAKKAKRGAKIRGVLVQEMVNSGEARELIVGAKIDPDFGPVVMFGLGGILVEVLKDVSFRVIPLTRKDAEEMIDEIRGNRILGPVRGRKPVNRKKLADCIIAVSRMMEKEKNIEELDLNPLFADASGVKAVDIRIMVK